MEQMCVRYKRFVFVFLSPVILCHVFWRDMYVLCEVSLSGMAHWNIQVWLDYEMYIKKNI